MSKTILIVDDEPKIVNLIGLRLKANGYEILTATSGTEGLEKCREHKPDAVIMDIMMPDMEGSEVAASIREDPDVCHIPIIFLTAVVKPHEVAKKSVRGGQYFIAKPFNSADLLGMLEKIFEK